MEKEAFLLISQKTKDMKQVYTLNSEAFYVIKGFILNNFL